MNSIKVKLPWDENNIKLYILSDCHIGDANLDINLLKKIIAFIKDTPNCYCILLGDILNTALKTSKSDIYSEVLSVADSQKLAIELLTPIKDKILAITPGNHEDRVWKECGIDLSLWLAERLGLEDKYSIENVALSISFGKDTNKEPFRLNIFGQHGAYGGGRRLGSAMNALEDLDGIVSNADIYIRAHTHNPISGKRDIFEFNQQGNLTTQHKYYYNAPSLLQYGGYAATKGYRPSNNEPRYLNIRAVSTRKRSTLEKTFKIDEIML